MMALAFIAPEVEDAAFSKLKSLSSTLPAWISPPAHQVATLSSAMAPLPAALAYLRAA